MVRRFIKKSRAPPRSVWDELPKYTCARIKPDKIKNELVATPPGVRDVRETNICRISVHRDGPTGRVVVFAVIDNLWKGAASQAVQNLNLMFGRPEGEGIS